MNNLTACIFNIQRYSIHDGPGIRTVVFFKGCPLKCLWCSNPESQKSSLELVLDKNKCAPSADCPNDCPHKVTDLFITKNIEMENKSTDYTSCVKACPLKALTVYGEHGTLDYVMKEIMKDKDFYEESGGGVTLSGGEVLMQHEFAIALLEKLKAQGIHTACESTGYTSSEIFQAFIKNIDLLLFDLKHYDNEKHFKGTGVHNEKIISNLKTAISDKKNVIVRIPVIPDFNNSLEDAEGYCNLLKEIGAVKVNLLPFHQFGEKKYTLLGKDYKFTNFKQLHEEDLVHYRNVFIENGFHCTI